MAAERAWRQPSLPSLRSIGLVAAGGALGGLGRAAIGAWAPLRPGDFPWVTFAENVAGAFLLGLLLTLILEGVIKQQWLGLLLGTGVLGAFTTFATLALQLQRLWVDGHAATAVAYALATTVVGLAMAAAGVAAGRMTAAARRRA